MLWLILLLVVFCVRDSYCLYYCRYKSIAESISLLLSLQKQGQFFRMSLWLARAASYSRFCSFIIERFWLRTICISFCSFSIRVKSTFSFVVSLTMVCSLLSYIRFSLHSSKTCLAPSSSLKFTWSELRFNFNLIYLTNLFTSLTSFIVLLGRSVLKSLY